MYQVIENAGMDNEKVVVERHFESGAWHYINKHYTQKEIEELRVDVVKNGSTEF